LPPDPSGWRSLLAVPRLWAMVVLLVVYARLLASTPSGDLASRLGKPSKGPILGASIFVAVVAVATIVNLRHVRAQAVSYRSRLLAEGPSLMAAEPALGGSRVYFSRWGDTGYVLDRTAGGGASRAGPEEDMFHPALASDADEGWVEIASLTSRIAHFRAPGATQNAAAWETEVESGEQPGVSPDGRWLGFIREERGRGSLWIKDRLRGTTAEVLDVTHDVRGFALRPDGRIVVASAAGGGSKLFVLDPKTGFSEAVDTSAHRAKNPAVSPDGRWLAYSREDSGSWQLWVMDLASRHQAPVTGGDCNSVEPAWAADSRRIVYASDCGRALGRTALCARTVSRSAPEPDGS
jgi:dipeptidyl aminopeptidase/acylaminoacyl peptidase